MAPASATALGINKLVNSILCLLPKKDLKSARLVRQQWASLGGQMLIGTLYISPRKIDMDAFDGITQNPDLAKSVKHLVYDSAQFLTFSAESYYTRLYSVQRDGGYLHLGSADAAVKEALGNREFKPHPLKPMQCLAQFDGKVIDGSSIEGFRQYSDYSKDRRTILEPSWFDRVVRGLKAISPLTCVAMRNTWNDIYHGDAIDNLYEEIVTCPGPASSPYGSERVRSCIVPVDLDDPDKGRLVNSGRIKSDGRPLVGSPSARAYPATGLLPLSLKAIGEATDTTDLSEVGMSNGQCELKKVVEVLHTSGQKPLQLNFLQDRPQLIWNGASTGASQFIFNVEGSLTADALVALADNLRSLRLDFEYAVTNPGEPNFQILAQFLHKATKLEEVGLEFPGPINYDVLLYEYRLDQIFKPIEKWTRPALTKLSLVRLSTGFYDLSRLLFVNLPKLKDLHLAHITLLDGIWEDVVEGLHQIVPLTTCKLALQLYQPNGYHYSLKDHATDDELTKFSKLTEFIEANNHYAVEEGGTHPGYPTYDLSYEFKQEIAHWKQLRADSVRARASE